MLEKRIACIAILIGLIVYLNKIYNYPFPEGMDKDLIEVKSHINPIREMDVSFLSEKLEGKRVILLGEQTHFDGKTFLIKEEIIRYLHENLGFNVILYEAGLYDMWQMNADPDTLNASQGLYSFWWDNNESKGIWEYYNNHRDIKDSLCLGGFDIQLTGQISDSLRVRQLEDYLLLKGIYLEEYKNFSHIKRDMSKYLGFYYSRQLSDALKDSILSDLDQILQKLRPEQAGVLSDKDEMFYRYIMGLRKRYESVWRYPNVGDSPRMHLRDSLMADNLIWLADSVFSEKKIIVWLSNLHAIHPADSTQFLPFKTLGQYMRSHYGDSLYSIVFSSYGRLNEENELKERLSRRSLEYLIHRTGSDLIYIDFDKIGSGSFLSRKFISGIDQGMNREAYWTDMANLLIYIDTMSAPTVNIQ